MDKRSTHGNSIPRTEEQYLARAERQDEHYLREVAAQRGDGDDVAFHWELSFSNGFVVRGAIPVAIHKCAQVAHIGPQS